MTRTIIRSAGSLHLLRNAPRRTFSCGLTHQQNSSTSSPSSKMMGSNGSTPQTNQPDSDLIDKSSSATPNKDRQSSASEEEHKTGDDHPAKQPDPQATPTRSTGIENADGKGTPGGKEALKDRSDR